LATGTTFAGRYQVIEELGKGGMGNVYKVYDAEVEEKVALKLLNPEIASDEETIKRFRNELKLARTISHKNVCRMYDLGQQEGVYYITMEYVAGENLKSFIRRSGQLTVDKAIGIAAEICEGLAEAHRLGVVHRDLKPQNIMIDQEGNARIMDFGIARSLKAKGVTGPGVIIGTPEYMSPEQVEGEAADQRSDIYAVGVILFEMLTGRVPFGGDTPFAIALKHKAEVPPDPREFNGRISEALSRLVLRCLEKDRDKRFQRPEDLLSGLAVIGQESRTTAAALSPEKPANKARPKLYRAVLVPGAILGALIILAIAVFFLLRSVRSPGKPQAGAAPPAAWKNSIAVLPFKDYSPQKDQEGICDGMTEAIIVRLSHFERLKVIGANSMLRYKDSGKDVRQIGTELGVENVVDGTVQREEDRIKVTAQLIASETQFVLWSNEYNQELKSIFDLQDEISRAIAEALKVRLLPGSAPILEKDRPANLEAYDYCMKGMSFIKSKFVIYFKEEDFRMGVEMFNNAIKLDPAYSLPYYGLCWAYEYHYQITGDEQDARMVQASAETAWRLDPDSALNNAVLGYVLYEYAHDRERAFGLFEKALSLNPNQGDVNFLAGMGYLYHGLYDQGIRYLAKAIELDPYNFWTPYKLAYCYMYSGEFAKAAFYFEKYFELAPVEPLVFPGKYIALNIMMKRYDKAEELVARGEKTTPDAEWVKKYRAALLAVRGERDKALALYRNSEIFALLGMKDDAFRELDKEIRGSLPYPYIFYEDLLHNPFYDKLRGDPRFQKLIDREKILYDEAVKRFGQK
jgi:TolB-like protein/Tfp pilus assembly protein PilF/predicted Ser/Thr protein kinase